jgi:hypothetical protein
MSCPVRPLMRVSALAWSFQFSGSRPARITIRRSWASAMRAHWRLKIGEYCHI